jgi:hypothetical protein
VQTTLAADAHLAEGQFLHEEQTLNKAKSDIIIITITTIIILRTISSMTDSDLYYPGIESPVHIQSPTKGSAMKAMNECLTVLKYPTSTWELDVTSCYHSQWKRKL